MMTVIMIVPFLFSIYITFHDVNLLENGGAFAFAGIKNFKTFFSDSRAIKSVFTSIKFLVGTLCLELFLGIAISVFLDRKFRGKGIIRALLIVPMFMTPVVSGLIWRCFFDANAGIVSYLYKLITHGQLDMLGTTAGAMWGIIIVDVWQWTPFIILMAMASLDGLPEDAIEAAKVEGATELQMVRYVKIPMIRPTICMAAILRAIEALKAFDTIYVMTKGGPGSATETMNMYAYTVGFEFYRIGYATTISFIFTMVVSVILSKLFQRMNMI
jgi:multiple sugar transport system permease protein